MHKGRDFPMVASRLVQNEIRKLYMDHKARREYCSEAGVMNAIAAGEISLES